MKRKTLDSFRVRCADGQRRYLRATSRVEAQYIGQTQFPRVEFSPEELETVSGREVIRKRVATLENQ